MGCFVVSSGDDSGLDPQSTEPAAKRARIENEAASHRPALTYVDSCMRHTPNCHFSPSSTGLPMFVEPFGVMKRIHRFSARSDNDEMCTAGVQCTACTHSVILTIRGKLLDEIAWLGVVDYGSSGML